MFYFNLEKIKATFSLEVMFWSYALLFFVAYDFLIHDPQHVWHELVKANDENYCIDHIRRDRNYKKKSTHIALREKYTYYYQNINRAATIRVNIYQAWAIRYILSFYFWCFWIDTDMDVREGFDITLIKHKGKLVDGYFLILT